MEIKNSKQVALSDRVRFRCMRCGECCRHVKGTVIIESSDAYRLAKYLGVTVDLIYEKYADVFFIENTGYPVFSLKAVGAKESCVFLKGNRCTVQGAKPRTCRMYPFWVEPNDSNTEAFTYNFTTERPHHPKGSLVRVKDWMNENFTDEDRAFLAEEWRAMRELAPLMKIVRTLFADEDDLLRTILLYRYLLFDLNKPFLEQQYRNDCALKELLERKIKNLKSV